MNAKNFLKPTIGKLVLLIILSLLAIYVSVDTARSRVLIQKGVEINELKVKIFQDVEIILLYPSRLIVKYIIAPKAHFSLDVIYSISLVDMLLLFTSVAIYWYLISCLIIFIYERLKEKLRKR